MPEFVAGLDLNEAFFGEVLRPFLTTHFPQLRYAAARLGSGSDVLGYDTPMSTDHDWGVRMQLFLSPDDHAQWATAVDGTLAQHLPASFWGHPVHFSPPNEQGVQVAATPVDSLINHRVAVTTIPQFFHDYLRLDPAAALTAVDWLTMPQQLLLGVTAGRVFADPDGELAQIRAKLATYPRDVWLYLLACQWQRIGQEEHFVGRTGYVGDDIGSRLLAARLVHDIMLLCFLQEKRYAPYAKWFGTAFERLACAAEIRPLLRTILTAETWPAREAALCAAYGAVARRHNQLGLTPPQRTDCVAFFDRPFQVLFAGEIASALRAEIRDPAVQRIHTHIGSIDQYSHSTDLLSAPRLHRRTAVFYDN